MAGTQRELIYGFCCLQRAESGGVVNTAITLFFQGHFGLTGPVAATAIDNHLALLVFTYDTATLIDRTDPPGSDGSIILTFTVVIQPPLNTIFHQSTGRVSYLFSALLVTILLFVKCSA
jgi:hypothetical protein